MHLLEMISLFLCIGGPPAVAERILWIRVCQSICPEVFLGLANWFFLKLSMVLEALVVLYITEPDFLKKIFLPQKMGKMGQKWVILIYWKNLIIIFFWIWSIMKVYVICIFLHKSHIWENSGSRDMGQNTFGKSNSKDF